MEPSTEAGGGVLRLAFGRSQPPREKAVVSFLLAGAAAAVLVLMTFQVARPDRSPVDQSRYLVSIIPAEHGRAEQVLLQGDAQFFYAVARDPGLSRPEVFRLGRAQAAYRAARPVHAYAAGLLGLGRPGAIPVALGVLAALGAGLSAACLARLDGLEERWRPAYAVGLVLVPGSLAALVGIGCELPALALGLGGLLAWHPLRPTDRRPVAAFVLFALAVLTRESMAVVPVGLFAWEAVQRRGWPGRRHVLLPLSVAPYAVWLAIVRVRVGAWPMGGQPDALALPFAWVGSVVPHWDAWSWLAAVVLGLSLVAGAVGALRWRSPYGFVAVCYGLACPVFGSAVWSSWLQFSRPMLPAFVLGLAAVLARAERPVRPAVAPAVPPDGAAAVPTPR